MKKNKVIFNYDESAGQTEPIFVIKDGKEHKVLSIVLDDSVVHIDPPSWEQSMKIYIGSMYTLLEGNYKGKGKDFIHEFRGFINEILLKIELSIKYKL